jgi:glycosyltransferase involved in cell wall biosynthesis
MRILQLHARYRIPAGEDSVVDNEAGALERGGHVVRRFVLPNPHDRLAAAGALARSLHNAPVAAEVRRVVADFGPDVVHVHNTWFALSSSAIEAAADAGVPVVMTVHNYRLGCLGADLFRDGAVCTACVGRSPWRGVVHACYRGSRLQSAVQAAEVVVTRRRNVLDRCVRRFVAPSQFMADRLVELGLPRDRLHVKAHFVADPGPRPSPPSSSSRVLSVGRLAPGKGLDTLVDAWNRLDGSDGRTLTIVGDGPLAPSLGHAAGIERPGWLPRHEVTERLLTARALVMPSEWYEPFGMVLVEAMSAGLPIVVTTAAGARAIVGPDGAVAVPPRDAAALAGAIESLDDDTVDRLGAANRRRYDARYTESAGLAALEELYRSVLPGAQG